MDAGAGDVFKRFLERDILFYLTLAVVCAAIILRSIIFNDWGDIDTCYWERTGHVMAGEVPYRDFVFEYPPLSLLFMMIPRLLSWDQESFRIVYMIFTSVFYILSAMILDRVSERYIGNRWEARLVMLLLLLALSIFILQRNDIFPVALVLASLWLYLSGRYEIAFAVMAVAGMTKLYPMLFLVPMMLPFLMRLDWRMMVKGVVIVGAVALLSELPFLIADPSTALDYLLYHSDRGLQVESIASSIIMMMSLFTDMGISVVFNYGSDNLTGALPDSIAPYMNLVMMAVLVLFMLAVLFVYRKADLKGREGSVLAVLCLVLIMIFVTFSKVYSTQYIVWVVTLIPFAFMSCLSRIHRKEIWILTLVYILFSMFSLLGYMDLIKLEPYAIVLSFLKNVSFVVLMAEVAHLFWFELMRKDGEPDRGLFIRG